MADPPYSAALPSSCQSRVSPHFTKVVLNDSTEHVGHGNLQSERRVKIGCLGNVLPERLGAGSADFVPSWCNGSAGFVHLWLSAERVLGDEGYRELAYGAARDALGPMETGVDLCCGLAGRAYALLALHRASGDDIWLREARALAVRALRPRMLDAPFALSLYKGVFGLVVLAEELRAPMTASIRSSNRRAGRRLAC
jgi:hypothetical protein